MLKSFGQSENSYLSDREIEEILRTGRRASAGNDIDVQLFSKMLAGDWMMRKQVAQGLRADMKYVAEFLKTTK